VNALRFQASPKAVATNAAANSETELRRVTTRQNICIFVCLLPPARKPGNAHPYRATSPSSAQETRPKTKNEKPCSTSRRFIRTVASKPHCRIQMCQRAISTAQAQKATARPGSNLKPLRHTPPTRINKHARRTSNRWRPRLRKSERRKAGVSHARKPSLADGIRKRPGQTQTRNRQPRKKNHRILAIHRPAAQPMRGQDARTPHDMDRVRAAACRAIRLHALQPLNVRHSKLRKSSATARRDCMVAQLKLELL
jgi:hypothetical protein